MSSVDPIIQQPEPEPSTAPPRSLSVRQAVFIGLGLTVGAGIFAAPGRGE